MKSAGIELFGTEKEPAPSANGTSPKNNIISDYDDNTIIIICQEKIDNEYKNAKKLSQKGKVVGPSVINALKNFVAQNKEFAQAIMQSDKPVSDCIEYTVKDCGNAISDLDVYKRAAEFYFEGATVHMTLTIDLGDEGFSNVQDKPITVSTNKVELSLDSLLDF